MQRLALRCKCKQLAPTACAAAQTGRLLTCRDVVCPGADKLRTLSSSLFKGILPSARRSSADSTHMDRQSLGSALRSSSDGRELAGSQNADHALRRTSVTFADEVGEDKPAS